MDGDKDRILDRKHIIQVLKESKEAINKKDSLKLKELSNQTIHCAASNQDSGSVSIAVIIYALSKIIEREDYKKIKNWAKLSRKILSCLELASKATEQDNLEAFEKYIVLIRKTISTASPSMKNYLDEILKKAEINKAGKFYEHGLSLGKTAELLGISQWEVSEYTGQSRTNDYTASPLSVRERVKLTMEFLS